MLGSVAAFVLIGAQQSLYGPAIPALRANYHISAATAGAALSVHFAGAMLGVLALPLSRRLRLPDHAALGISLALIAAGCFTFLISPDWLLSLAGAFVAGVGSGGIDGGVNQIFTEVYTEGSHGTLNLLHGCFGLGAIVGPVAVALLPSYGWAFAGCTLLALLVLPMLHGVAGVRAVSKRSRPVQRGLFGFVGLAFITFFVLNVGLESSTGGWEATHLISIGLPPHTAASATSGFWLAFTAVRFAVVPLCRRYSARIIVIAFSVLAVVAAVLTMVDPFAPAAYALLGVAVGPLFPTGLAWLAETRANLTSTVLGVSMGGGIAFPWAIGLVVEEFGPAEIPKALLVLAALGLITVFIILRDRPAAPSRS